MIGSGIGPGGRFLGPLIYQIAVMKAMPNSKLVCMLATRYDEIMPAAIVKIDCKVTKEIEQHCNFIVFSRT